MRERYFEAEPTAYREARKRSETVFAIYAGEKSRKNPDGSTSAFLRFPALIVSEYTANGDEFAKTVADVLEENASRFFASATSSDAGLKSEAKRSDEVEPAGESASLTPIIPNDLKSLIDALRSGKSYDPHHVAAVIESLHAAYVSVRGGSND
jgi:hypothetical protein